MYVEFYRFDDSVLFLVTYIPVECGFVAQKVIFKQFCTVKLVKLDPRNSVKACPHHTVSWAWCYDHYVSKLTLCDLGLYHMFTSICVLMYLYYIYLLISAMMDLLSDEVPPIFYERLRRRILSKVGDRFAYGMGCWMWLDEKKIDKMDPLALYQNNGE